MSCDVKGIEGASDVVKNENKSKISIQFTTFNLSLVVISPVNITTTVILFRVLFCHPCII